MTTRTTLFYRTFHNDLHCEIKHFNTIEEAQEAAANMIEQFKYWGGGSVPVTLDQTKWTKAGKYHSTTLYKEYPQDLYIEYARENGNLCGYLQNKTA